MDELGGCLIFVDVLTQFAEQRRNPRLAPIIRRAGAPVRVAVHGRSGVGRTTVTAALTGSGVAVSTDAADADVAVHVIAEILKPEDRLAVSRSDRPTAIILNKADLTAFGAGGPLASAERHAAAIRASTNLPTVPMVGLLAVAELDDALMAALRRLVHAPADLTSTDAFVQSDHPLPEQMRRRLLDELDRFGIAHAVLAVHDGADAPAVRALLRRISRVGEAVAVVEGAAAPVRYRRVCGAIAELHALAIRSGDQELAGFLASDDTVLAVMGAAVEVVEAHGIHVDRGDDPSAHRRRACVLAALRQRTGRRLAPQLRGRYLPRLAASPRAAPVTSDVVLLVGPPMAGTTSLAGALRARLPEYTFVESGELNPAHAPAAVVFTVSAVAPLTESDCALIDSVAKHTDLVVGVVSKNDAHRNWREVLAADRALLTQHAPRYAQVHWVGAAAAPDLGEARLDELVGQLRQRLSDPVVAQRNQLRARESRILRTIGRYRADGDGSDRRARVRVLHEARDDILRRRRLSKSERNITLRSQLKAARVQLGHFARNRCTAARGHLAEDAAQLSRRGIGTFESHVRTRVREVVEEVDEGVTEQLAHVATELHLPVPPATAPPQTPQISAPPLTSRRQETQLMTILGAGFGLGVALVVTRLFAGLAPGMTAAGLAVGGAIGLVLTVWVVGLRGLLHDRGVLDRWVGDVISVLRSSVEERVATRILVAETALCSELAHRDEVDSATAADRVAEIDAELHEHAVVTARAAKVIDSRLPLLQQQLDAVRRGLYGSVVPEKPSS